jgi:hypothetical protein
MMLVYAVLQASWFFIWSIKVFGPGMLIIQRCIDGIHKVTITELAPKAKVSVDWIPTRKVLWDKATVEFRKNMLIKASKVLSKMNIPDSIGVRWMSIYDPTLLEAFWYVYSVELILLIMRIDHQDEPDVVAEVDHRLSELAVS